MNSKRTKLIMLTASVLFILLIVVLSRKYSSDSRIISGLIPVIESSQVHITEINSNNTYLTIKSRIKNPSPFTFRIDSIDYVFLINGNTLFKSQKKETVIIRHNKSNWLTFPLKLNNKTLFRLHKDLSDKTTDSLDYELKATFYSNLLNKSFTIDKTKRLPALYIPEIKINKIELDSLNRQRIRLMVHSMIYNQNVFSLNAKNLTYQLKLGKSIIFNGTVEDSIHIPDKSAQEILIPINISYHNSGKIIKAAFMAGSNLDYLFTTDFIVTSNHLIFHNAKVKLIATGEIKDVLNFIKKN